MFVLKNFANVHEPLDFLAELLNECKRD
jgi:hypothetical protein